MRRAVRPRHLGTFPAPRHPRPLLAVDSRRGQGGSTRNPSVRQALVRAPRAVPPRPLQWQGTQPLTAVAAPARRHPSPRMVDEAVASPWHASPLTAGSITTDHRARRAPATDSTLGAENMKITKRTRVSAALFLAIARKSRPSAPLRPPPNPPILPPRPPAPSRPPAARRAGDAGRDDGVVGATRGRSTAWAGRRAPRAAGRLRAAAPAGALVVARPPSRHAPRPATQRRSRLPRMKRTFAGRSARRRMK